MKERKKNEEQEEMGMLRRRNGYYDFKKGGLRVFVHMGCPNVFKGKTIFKFKFNHMHSTCGWVC
jgi:hypothetical protein